MSIASQIVAAAAPSYEISLSTLKLAYDLDPNGTGSLKKDLDIILFNFTDGSSLTISLSDGRMQVTQ